ncbi:MAG TPA: BatA domain-containing protein [Planctomycetota bacterium]|nr:BatA domain-containing protein [Planctomycetota bacterium]
MTFLNPWFLAGLAAVAVPVLIHILQRDRIKRIKFPATRFLMGASKRITRTQQLRELILLILRGTVVALLAIALTRPFFMKEGADSAAAGLGAKATIVIVDTSASMRIGSRMDEAKRQAESVLSGMRAGLDRAGVLTFDHGVDQAAPLSPEIKPALTAISSLTAGNGSGDLAAAIKKADELLQADDVRHCARNIVVVSDLQRSGWSQFHGDWKLSPGVEISVKPVTLKVIENVAITQVAIPKSAVVSDRPETLSLQLANFSAKDRPATKITLSLDGKKVDEKALNLGPNKIEVVRFPYKFDQPGDVAGTLTVSAEDEFADDNTWYFNVRVLPLVQVLLVNGGMAKEASRDDGRFTKGALSVPGSPFQVREIAPSAMTAKDLENTQAVILANVGTLPSAVLPSLKTFVENGGGLMIFVGDKVEPEEFNKTFAGVAPCRLKQVAVKDDKSEGWTIGEIDFQHPIFTHFSAPQSGDFSAAKFTKYMVVTDSQASKVLARYIDGRPALLEQNLGNGFVLLFTSSAGMKWNDLCLNGGVFVPFIHESMKYLAVHSEGLTNAAVGDALGFNSAVELTAPDGSALNSTPGSTPPAAKLPGLYSVKRGDKNERLAVNIPRSESEVPLLDAAELSAAIASNPEGQQKEIEGVKVWVAASNSVRERIEGGQKIGWYLLVAVVMLLFGEHLLANATSRN